MNCVCDNLVTSPSQQDQGLPPYGRMRQLALIRLKSLVISRARQVPCNRRASGASLLANRASRDLRKSENTPRWTVVIARYFACKIPEHTKSNKQQFSIVRMRVVV